MRRRGIVVAGAVLLLVIAGAAVAVSTDIRTRDDEAGVGMDSAARSATEPAMGAAGAGAGASGGAKLLTPVPPGGGRSQTVDPAGPRIVRNAELSVEVAKGRFGEAFDRVATIAAGFGGYVTSSSTTASGGQEERPRSGYVTVRVPSDRFEDAKRAFGGLGTVEQTAERGEDVSGQIVDYEARLRSLSAQEESLRALLGKAVSVGEVLQVQTSLFDVRQQIEQLQAQRLQLDQAASLATLQLSLYEPGALVGPGPGPDPEPASGLARSLERAWDGSVAVVGGMIVVLGYLAPVALLGLLGWAGSRLRRRPQPAIPATTPAGP